MKIRILLLTAGAMVVSAAERFDLEVRNDFFAGFSGNKEALDRAMQNPRRSWPPTRNTRKPWCGMAGGS